MIKLNQTEDTGAAVCTSAHRADEDTCKGGELRFIVAMFTRSTHHNVVAPLRAANVTGRQQHAPLFLAPHQQTP